MTKRFPYKVGQAVAGMIPGPSLGNCTVTKIDSPDAHGYRRVHVLFPGEEQYERFYLVSPSGASDQLLNYPLRPTLNDDRVNPDERYTVTKENGASASFVVAFEGAPIGSAATEAECWTIALIHDWNARNGKRPDGGIA